MIFCIVGEKLNSSIPKTLEALKTRNEAALIKLIKSQAKAGAVYLDINTACGNNEIEDMLWLCGLAAEHSDCGIMVDSPDIECIKSVLPKLPQGLDIFVNSLSPDTATNECIDVIRLVNAKVVCLPMHQRRVPQTAQQRFEETKNIHKYLTEHGIPSENIYIDILTEALATSNEAGTVAIETLQLCKKIPVKTICGLSNISFGLPERGKLNATFLSILMSHGLDAAILDPTSAHIKSALYMSNALLGRDEYCMDYIGFIRTSNEQ